MQYEEAIRTFLETVSQFYYDGEDKVSVVLEDSDTAYCDEHNKICLPPSLLEDFRKNNLPCFCLYYHELGHALFSAASYKFLDGWKNQSTGIGSQYDYNSKYIHLINWIEDFYIEQKMVELFPYLQDIIKCLKLIPFQIDYNDVHNAFNYYYVHKKAMPALNFMDQYTFVKYIEDLLALRSNKRFNQGLSLIQNNNCCMQYLKLIVDFYNWCVSKSIFDKNVTLPPLKLPTNVLQEQKLDSGMTLGDMVQYENVKADAITGSTSEHDKTYRKFLVEKMPDIDTSLLIANTELTTMLSNEEKILSRYFIQDCDEPKETSLDGLFTSLFNPSNIIGKPIIPNFFNYRRYEDRILFKNPLKIFNNVSIYRDVSGSTHGTLFKLFDNVCEYLIEHIPIDVHFYLYASGKISIYETAYVKWPVFHDKPLEYSGIDLGGGTNSDAIADVITQQLDDQWLNIVITDGDLNALFQRQNIDSLLNNIAIINLGDSINMSKINPEHYVHIKDMSEINKAIEMLLNYRKVE